MEKYTKDYLLEMLRTWYIAILAAALPALTALLMVPTEQLLAALKSPITYLALAQVVILGLIKGKDRANHELGSRIGDAQLEKGLTGF